MRLIHLLIINFLITTGCMASYYDQKVELKMFFDKDDFIDSEFMKAPQTITMIDYLKENNRFELYFENKLIWSTPCQQLLDWNAYDHIHDLYFKSLTRSFELGYQVLKKNERNFLETQSWARFDTDIIDKYGFRLKKLNLFFFIDTRDQLVCMSEMEYDKSSIYNKENY